MDVEITGTTMQVDEQRIAANPATIRGKLGEYLSGERIIFGEPIDLSDMTEFQQRVLGGVRTIPYGETITYAELAERIGNPSAVRAVGTACGANPVPIVIPCHRIVASEGIGGYSGGIAVKKTLLLLEA